MVELGIPLVFKENRKSNAVQTSINPSLGGHRAPSSETNFGKPS